MNTYNQALIGLLGTALLITAGCANHATTSSQEYRETADASSSAKKLGTKWGEDVNSAVTKVNASRLTNTPFDTATIYYRGETVPKHIQTMNYIALSPVEIKVTDQRGRSMPIYRNNQGQHVYLQKRGNVTS